MLDLEAVLGHGLPEHVRNLWGGIPAECRLGPSSADNHRFTNQPRFDVTLGSVDPIIARDSGFWASIRQGLATSAAGLMWSLQLIVIGLCFVLPWMLVIWIAWKILRRRRVVA